MTHILHPGMVRSSIKETYTAPINLYSFPKGADVIYYNGVETREKLLNEAVDVFSEEDSQLYHAKYRLRNAKGETKGVELLKVGKIKQLWLDMLIKMRTRRIK